MPTDASPWLASRAEFAPPPDACVPSHYDFDDAAFLSCAAVGSSSTAQIVATTSSCDSGDNRADFGAVAAGDSSENHAGVRAVGAPDGSDQLLQQDENDMLRRLSEAAKAQADAENADVGYWLSEASPPTPPGRCAPPQLASQRESDAFGARRLAGPQPPPAPPPSFRLSASAAAVAAVAMKAAVAHGGHRRGPFGCRPSPAQPAVKAPAAVVAASAMRELAMTGAVAVAASARRKTAAAAAQKSPIDAMAHCLSPIPGMCHDFSPSVSSHGSEQKLPSPAASA